MTTHSIEDQSQSKSDTQHLSNFPKRSILKQASSQNTDLTDSQISTVYSSQPIIPFANGNNHESFDSSNTTSKINTIGLQSRLNRRVSFAPDVTLHSFDFVTNVDMPLKGRSTDNSLSQSSVIANDKMVQIKNLTPTISEPINEDGDSSMSMEFTQPLNTSIEQNNILHRPSNSQLDSTMDMTQIYVGDTQVKSTKKSENMSISNDVTMDFTKRQERMSPILLPFDRNESLKEDEVPMDLTDGQGKLSPIILPLENNDDSNNEETMDPTELLPQTVFSNEPPTIIKKNDLLKPSTPQNNSSKEQRHFAVTNEVNEPMDLTQKVPNENINDTNIIENRIQYPKEHENMDMTSIYKPHKNSNQSIFMANESNDNNVEPMDFTQVQHTELNEGNNDMELTETNINRTMEITQRHTGSGEISMEEKSSVEEVTMDLTELQANNKSVRRIDDDDNDNADDDRKRAKFFLTSTDAELSNAEVMSPIKMDDINTNIEKGTKKEYYSLKNFLEEIDSGFLTDSSLFKSSTKRFNFPLVQLSPEKRKNISNIYTALYSDIPMLQMDAFISKELFKMNEHSKAVFNDLQDQINSSRSPPLLLREYYKSSTNTKKAIDGQLKLVKSYCDLDAKKTWYKWRLSHLDNIKGVLKENLNILQMKSRSVQEKFEKYKRSAQEIKEIKEYLKREILLLKDSGISTNREPTLEKKIKIEKIKQYLRTKRVAISEAPKLLEEKRQIESQLDIIRHNISELENSQRSAIYLENIEKKLIASNDKLLYLQNITGIKFSKIIKSQYFVQFQSNLNFEIQIDLNETCLNMIDRISNEEYSEFFILLFKQRIEDLYDINRTVHEIFPSLLISIRSMLEYCEKFTKLQAVFITHILREIDARGHIIEFKDYDFETKTKLVYQISLYDFVNLHPLQVRATLVSNGNNNVDAAQMSLSLTKKTRNTLPWLSGATLVLDQQ